MTGNASFERQEREVVKGPPPSMDPGIHASFTKEDPCPACTGYQDASEPSKRCSGYWLNAELHKAGFVCSRIEGRSYWAPGLRHDHEWHYVNESCCGGNHHLVSTGKQNEQRVIEAPSDTPVFICGAEHDMSRLASMGLVATMIPNEFLEWKAAFDDRLIVLVSGDTSAGHGWADRVAWSLHGRAREVRIVWAENLPSHDCGGDS